VRDVRDEGANSTSLPCHSAANAITLRQLQYFVAVAEAEHFTRASESLEIAQPSLSRQVRDLEDVLGVDLFVRDTRGVRLTEAGRELLARTQTMFVGLERTVDAVRRAGRGERGRLRLGYYGPCFYSNPITRSGLERFRERVPDVEVILHELFPEQLVPALRDSRIDLGIGDDLLERPDIESRVLATERLVVMLPETDELASKPAVAVADLQGRNLITFHSDLTNVFRRVAEIASGANVPLRIAREFTHIASMIYHVSRNEGVAIVASSTVGTSFPGVVVREMEDSRTTINIVALTRRGEESSAALRFVEALLDRRSIA
jgi:DNA-binding transcriptional LysR family regulator